MRKLTIERYSYEEIPAERIRQGACAALQIEKREYQC
jgi:hypothetical protein